jgi:hypothetical protein
VRGNGCVHSLCTLSVQLDCSRDWARRNAQSICSFSPAPFEQYLLLPWELLLMAATSNEPRTTPNLTWNLKKRLACNLKRCEKGSGFP